MSSDIFDHDVNDISTVWLGLVDDDNLYEWEVLVIGYVTDFSRVGVRLTEVTLIAPQIPSSKSCFMRSRRIDRILNETLVKAVSSRHD